MYGQDIQEGAVYIYKPGANVNDRFRIFSKRAERLSEEQQASLIAAAARRKERERKALEAAAEEQRLIRETREYIAYLKKARAKGRKPRLARKVVREHLQNLLRAGNFGRDKPRKKK